jgi:signal transduction histidine kinase
LHEIIESYPDSRARSADIQLKGPFPTVLAHGAILTQCISNLLANALKFVAPGITPRVHIWSELTKDGTAARLLFKDNGIGIDPAFTPGFLASSNAPARSTRAPVSASLS